MQSFFYPQISHQHQDYLQVQRHWGICEGPVQRSHARGTRGILNLTENQKLWLLSFSKAAQNPIFRGRILCQNGHCVASVPAKVLFSCQPCTNCSISCHCTNCRGRNRQENIFGNKLNTGCMANTVQICVFQNNDPIVLRNFSEEKLWFLSFSKSVQNPILWFNCFVSGLLVVGGEGAKLSAIVW